MGYPSAPGDEWERFFKEIAEIKRRLSEMERPDGSQTAQLVQQLFDLINGVLEQTDVNVSGNVLAGGVGQFGGAGSFGSNLTIGGYLFTTAGYAYDITYTRRAAWLGNDGRLGYASSSLDKKILVDDVDLPDPQTILEIADCYYVYKAEVAKRDDPEHPEYDPNYKVHLEYGHIAQWLHEAGLWQAVVYENGEPVAVHDNVLAGFAIRAAKFVWQEHQKLEQRVTALENA